MTDYFEVRLAGHAVRPIQAALAHCPVHTVGGQVAALIRTAHVHHKGTGSAHLFNCARHEAEYLAVLIDDLVDGELRDSLLVIEGDARRHARRALKEALERLERVLV